jgi:hypothetical protein
MRPAMGIHRPSLWAAAVAEIAAMAGAIIGRHRRRRVMAVPATAIPAMVVLAMELRVIRHRPVIVVRRRVALVTVVLAVLRRAMGNRRGRPADMPVPSASRVARRVRR